MSSIASEKELSALILKALRLRPVTNGRAFGRGYGPAIAEASLQVLELEQGLAVLEARGVFFRLHLWLAPQTDAMEKQIADLKGLLPKGIYVTEWAFRPSDEGVINAIEALKGAGFREILSRRRMEADPEVFAEKKKDTGMLPEGFVFRRAIALDEPSVQKLFQASYEPLTGCLPKERELLSSIEEGLVYLIEKDGRTACALHLEKSRNLLEVRHLAAAKAFRRQGLAAALLDAAFAMEGCPRCRLWASPENLPAVSLYEKKGFIWQDNYSKVLLLEI